jgi:hypothetical protein
MFGLIVLGLLASAGAEARSDPMLLNKGRLTVQRPDWCRTVKGHVAPEPGRALTPGETKADSDAKQAPPPDRCASDRLTVPRPEITPR